MLVALLTETEKNLLSGNTYTTDSFFNPIQDCNDNWIISTQEIQFCTNEDFSWIHNLPLIEYCPKLILDGLVLFE
jgi:hypothetical protein